jgi:hypothetical protein
LWVTSFVVLAIAGALGLNLAFNSGTGIVNDRRGSRALSPNIDQALAPQLSPSEPDPQWTAAAPQLPGLPVPSSFGVYAVSAGQLYELQPLSVRVPDPRILISADISAPSQTILPDGKVTFIVYRRELVNNAPERMSVRIVARVAREMSFSGGAAVTKNVSGSWRIRSNSVPLRVAPAPGTSEMIIAQPESALTFPAGRYVLVHNGRGYDFTVDGPVVTAAQCLELVEATNGSLYTECRKP